MSPCPGDVLEEAQRPRSPVAVAWGQIGLGRKGRKRAIKRGSHKPDIQRCGRERSSGQLPLARLRGIDAGTSGGCGGSREALATNDTMKVR